MDAVPVVVDSRSEALTDGQETPFLPPACPGMSYKIYVGSELEPITSQETLFVSAERHHTGRI